MKLRLTANVKELRSTKENAYNINRAVVRGLKRNATNR